MPFGIARARVAAFAALAMVPTVVCGGDPAESWRVAVERLRETAEASGAMEVPFRECGTIGGRGGEAMMEVFSQVPRGGVVLDPFTQAELVVVWTGVFRTDGRGNYRVESTPASSRRTGPAHTRVEVWTRGTRWSVPRIGAAQAEYRPRRSLAMDERLERRRKGQVTYEEQESHLGYVPLCRYVAEVLEGTTDAHGTVGADGIAEVSSEAFGVTARIEPATGRILRASMVGLDGQGSTFEFGGWLRGPGGEHPGWRRESFIGTWSEEPPIVMFYDEPRPTVLMPEDLDWRGSADEAFDVVRRVIVSKDGSERVPPKAVDRGASPLGDVVATEQGTLALRRSPWIGGWLWVGGVSFIIIGGVLWVRRAAAK